MRLANAARDVRTMKLLLTRAEQEAGSDGAEMPGAEHLVLAALALPDGTARGAFERAGLDPDDFRAAIARQHVDALRELGIDPGDAPASAPARGRRKPTGPMRSTANAQKLFQEALALARAERHAPLTGAHIVLALTGLEHGTAARALTTMGADRAVLARAARDELAEPMSV